SLSHLGAQRELLVLALLRAVDGKTFGGPIDVVKGQRKDFSYTQTVDGEKHDHGPVTNLDRVRPSKTRDETLNVTPLQPLGQAFKSEDARRVDRAREPRLTPAFAGRKPEERTQSINVELHAGPSPTAVHREVLGHGTRCDLADGVSVSGEPSQEPSERCLPQLHGIRCQSTFFVEKTQKGFHLTAKWRSSNNWLREAADETQKQGG